MKKRVARLGPLVLALAAVSLIGASPASAKKPKTKIVTTTVPGAFSQCQNLSVPVTDRSTHRVQFTVPSPAGADPAEGSVTSVSSAAVRITHTNDADIVIFLISPGGRVVPLFLGRPGDNDLGSGATNCGGTLTTFSDLATTPLSSGTFPYNGAFKPEGPLSTFNGGAASGIWTLLIADSLGGDVGTIHAASLSLTFQHTVKTKVKKKRKKK